MTTSKILTFLEKDQKVIDNDSFSIIKNLVKNMEEYDDFYLRSKTEPKYDEVMGELRNLSHLATEIGTEDLIFRDPAVRGISIKPTYSKILLREIKMVKKMENLLDQEWDVQENYSSDEEMDFQGTTLSNYDMFF